MIVSKKTLEKIKKIIENNYRGLLISITGPSVLSEEELLVLKRAGYDVKDKDSLLSLIYYNNVINDLSSQMGPISILEMQKQQQAKPSDAMHRAVEEHLNENFAQVVEKLKSDVQAKTEGLIRDYNITHRNKVVQNKDRPKEIDKLVKQSSVGGLKEVLRDSLEGSEKDFERLAITETSNALGMGSVDRIVAQNKDKKHSEIYVYRIPVNDALLCKFCRKFYLDGDESPAVYRLSQILNNGSNYGKKSIDWKAVSGATHPNERCSGILELRPGWKVTPGGKVDFIGYEGWKEYISSKIRD